MPTYDYDCAACGPFEQRRAISERDAPVRCPACEGPGVRVLAGSPRLARLDGGTRQAMASHEQAVGSYPRMRHAASCRCC